MSTKVYNVNDLFFTSWVELAGNAKAHAEVFMMHQAAREYDKAAPGYGFLLLSILRRLRKRPSLVDRIDVAQAVDIYNDLAFLEEPWYFFPSIPGLHQPDDLMARHTFDHFIYADNEFSRFIASQDTQYLARLLVTIYQMPFDKESVDNLARNLKIDTQTLHLVYYTFGHVRNYLVKRCKTLLPTTSVGDAEKTPTGSLWLKIKHRLAETPAFQGYDTAGRANMWSALDYLEDLAQQKQHAEHTAHKPR